MRRRDVLLAAGAGLTCGLVSGFPYIRKSAAQPARQLSINVVSNTLGIQVPYVAMLNEILPAMPGYGPVKWARMSSQETLAQAALTGTVEIAGTDPITALRAVEAGADMKIIGNQYFNSPLALVANSERIKNDSDFERSDITWATNAPRDQMYVGLARPLEERGIDLTRVNALAISGSGNRLRALLSGKLDAAPLHIDQAWEVIQDPKYRIVARPRDAFKHYLTEVWMASSAWLEKPENQRAATDLMKATITSFRNAHDPQWYAKAYRTHCTDAAAKTKPDAEIEKISVEIANVIDAWPKNMMHRVEVYEEIMPYYRKYGAVKGTADLRKVVDTRFSDRALEELGA